MAGVLDDGRYEVIVVDAEEDGTAIRLDVAVAAGAHKGEMVTLRAEGLDADALDLLATPATLVVADGDPTVTFEV